jgi:hypothetical protein
MDLARLYMGLVGTGVKRVLVRCPHCDRPVPITRTICSKCENSVSAGAAASKTFEKIEVSYDDLLAGVTPKTKFKIQRIYFLLSAVVAWLALRYVLHQKGEGAGTEAFFTILYLAILGLFVWWFVPRHLLFLIVQRTTRTMKFSLLLNYVSLLMLVQVWFVTWKEEAAVIAAVFLSSWCGAYVLCRLFWPMSMEMYSLFFGEDSKPFDPRNPQGRTGRFS